MGEDDRLFVSGPRKSFGEMKKASGWSFAAIEDEDARDGFCLWRGWRIDDGRDEVAHLDLTCLASRHRTLGFYMCSWRWQFHATVDDLLNDTPPLLLTEGPALVCTLIRIA